MRFARWSSLVPEQEQARRERDADPEEEVGVHDEVGIGHEDQAREHWFPDMRSLSVDESNEPDGTEEQVGNDGPTGESGQGEVGHAFASAITAPQERIDPPGRGRHDWLPSAASTHT